MFKGIKAFDKTFLTSKNLMMADLSKSKESSGQGADEQREFKDKVAKCFEMRVDTLKKR